MKKQIIKYIEEKSKKSIKELNPKQILNYVRFNKELVQMISKFDKSLSESIFLILNDLFDTPKCDCGNNVKFINMKLGYHKYCSNKCMSNSGEVKDKIVKTNLKRYGTEYGLQNKDVRKKVIKTNLKKYGVDNPSKNEKIKNKIVLNSHKTFKENFIKKLFESNDRLNNLVKPLFSIEDYNSTCTNYEWQCIKCNSIFIDNLRSGKIPRCPKCFPKYSSIYENEIKEFLINNNIKIISNDRTLIYPYELDIIIPDYKIAIELNGLYWHSELNGKDRNYHLNKTNLCKNKEYQLLQIFDYEWYNNKEIVKSIIKAKLGIFDNKIGARKCNIKKLQFKQIKQFLKDNHIQESVNSSINYGLFYQDELTAVTTFSKSRFRKDNSYELLRFCSKINTQVIGGFNKLINQFKKDFPNEKLISYCDKRYSNGKGYLNAGWKLIGESKQNYWYIINGHHESRIKYQKHKLKNILKNYNDTLTEWQNMQLNGYDRIWDCGNLIFEK